MDVSEYISLYTSETAEILQALESGLMEFEDSSDVAAIDELFRHAHNLKGMSGTMGFESVVEASHAMENILDDFRSGRSKMKRAQADALLKVVDILRDMICGVVENGECDSAKGLLGRIVTIISSNFENSCGTDKEDGRQEVEKAEAAKAEDQTDEEPVDAGPEDPEDNEDNTTESPSGAGGEEENTSADGKCKTDKVLNTAYYSRISSTRVELNRLDNLMDLVGELIISRIRLSNIAEGIESKALHEELTASGRLISEIQKEVVEARLVPAGNVFQRFKRLVRDISTQLGKEAKFTIIGADIGLDKMVLETMIDPLIHLIRNSIDHGIETPEERKAAGKSETGMITLSARRERNFVIIELSDDGRGIDVSQVSRKVGSKGDSGSKTDMPDEELCRILTSPGFSTREKADRFSGRGVGMNAVKEAVDSLGGSMSIKNKLG
jgi:two-component system chemotaxis sensor kinase CheA